MNKCKDCFFFVVEEGNTLIPVPGDCHRKAPSALRDKDEIVTYWPLVNEDDFCGEFFKESENEPLPPMPPAPANELLREGDCERRKIPNE